MRTVERLFTMVLLVCLTLSGCMSDRAASDPERQWTDIPDGKAPDLPEQLKLNEEGIPILKVYDVSDEKLKEMDLEEYVQGVVAGEMKNDWPLEALKAQAILARTFVLKFCDTKQSSYEGADISTDVSEAQAYAPCNINDRVRQAVSETKGLVMAVDGEYPHAWFFAHAGGRTELPSVALDYSGKDPDYLRVTESPDSEKAPENVKSWMAEFTADQVIRACAEAGLKIESLETIEIGERGESGRAKTLLVNGKSVSAPSFRIHIGANKLKSTLIDKLSYDGEKVVFTGSGFGHGVGLSQWGAYELAERGEPAINIVQYYFKDVDILRMW